MSNDRYEYFLVSSNCGIVWETIRIILVLVRTTTRSLGIPYLKVFLLLNKSRIPQETANNAASLVKENMGS